jgi:hypothetical protein
VISWLYLMWCVRREYWALPFSRRQIFLQALRPITEDARGIIAYPDAFFHITWFDLDRARKASREYWRVKRALGEGDNIVSIEDRQ